MIKLLKPKSQQLRLFSSTRAVLGDQNKKPKKPKEDKPKEDKDGDKKGGEKKEDGNDKKKKK